MSILAIILAVIQYGPSIFHLVIEIIDLIKKLRENGQHEAATFAEASLGSAVAEYHRTRDRRLLRLLRDRLNAQCFGPNCPTPGPRAA